jgi:hypothetical protein
MRAEIIRCDTCTKEHNAEYVLPKAWVTAKQVDGYSEEEHHFCSKTCLIKWASIGIATCDVEIMVDVIRTNGHMAKQEREQKYGSPFCNDIIRDAEGNEIARAKG